MTSTAELRARYIEHLEARIRARNDAAPGPEFAAFEQELATLRTEHPKDCLALILDTLPHLSSANLVQAVGAGLLEDLLNDRAAAVHDEVVAALGRDERFRQAFACGTFASVDPSEMAEWIDALRDAGTTKQAERKRLFSKKWNAAGR